MPSSAGMAEPGPDTLPRGHGGRHIRLGSGTAWVVIVQLLSAVSTIIIGAIVARTLGPDGKGVLSLLQQSVGMLIALGDLGVGVAAIYYISKGEVRPGTVLGNALVALAAVSVVAFAGLTVLLRSRYAVIEVPWAYVLGAFALFVMTLTLTWTGAVVTGLEGTRGAARGSITATALALAAVIVLWNLGHIDPMRVVLSTAAGAAIGAVVGLAPVWKSIEPLKISRDAFKTMARYSLRLHAASAADLIHFRQDLLLVGWLSGPAAVGIYSVALSMAEIASRLPSAIGAAIQAQASRVSEESALDFSARALRITVVVTVATAGVLSVIVPVLIPAVFGELFNPAVGVFYLLVPRIMANSLVWPVSSYQSARGVVYWRVGVAAALVNAALTVFLVPVWGYQGAAVSAGVSHTLLIVLLMRRLCRDTARPLAYFLVPTHDDMTAVLSALRSYTRPST